MIWTEQVCECKKSICGLWWNVQSERLIRFLKGNRVLNVTIINYCTTAELIYNKTGKDFLLLVIMGRLKRCLEPFYLDGTTTNLVLFILERGATIDVCCMVQYGNSFGLVMLCGCCSQG